MQCPFDQVIDRRDTCSIKWDGVLENFGGEALLPMWVADMDFRPPEAVVKAISDRAEHGVFGYEKMPSSFIPAVLEWLKTRHDWEVESSWLAHSPGVVPGLVVSILALTKPGDKVVIQPPVYPPFYSILEQNGRKVVENRLVQEDGKYVMNLAELEEIFRSGVKTMLFCSPHNPVGRVWSKAELEALGKLQVKYGVTVLSDEIWSDLVFQNHKHRPLASLSPEVANQTLTFMAPSKTFNIAGLYFSNMIIPNDELRERFNTQFQRMAMGHFNVFGIVATEAAYRQGEEWLEALLDYLEENVRYVITELKKIAPQIKVLKPEGTFVLWLDCRELGIAPEELNKFFVQEAGIALNDGLTFGPVGEGFQRMNIGCPKCLITEALERMDIALAKL